MCYFVCQDEISFCEQRIDLNHFRSDVQMLLQLLKSFMWTKTMTRRLGSAIHWWFNAQFCMHSWENLTEFSWFHFKKWFSYLSVDMYCFTFPLTSSIWKFWGFSGSRIIAKTYTLRNQLTIKKRCISKKKVVPKTIE